MATQAPTISVRITGTSGRLSSRKSVIMGGRMVRNGTTRPWQYHPAMELRGRAVLVTGATGALGQAVARRLRDEGCELTLTGRRGDVLGGLAGELEAASVVADLAGRG